MFLGRDGENSLLLFFPASTASLATSANTATGNPLGSRVDVISDVLAYCPLDNFLYLAGVSKTWRAAWLAARGHCNNTAISKAASSPTRMKWVLDDNMFWLTAAQQQEHTTTPTTHNKMSTRTSYHNSSNIFITAAAAGNLFGLKTAARTLRWNSKSWLRKSNNITLVRRRVPEIAAEIGDLEILKWAVCQEGCPLNPNVWFFACKRGSLDVLEWLRKRACPTDLYSCAAGAASGGNLEALKWSRHRGHGWDRFVCFAAASAGDLEMLRWATSQGCPWDKQRCASTAEANGHHTVVEWVNNIET